MNGPCKPRKLQPGAALLFGVLIGLSLLPVLKFLAGTQLLSCNSVSLCPTIRNATAAALAPAGPAAAFSSFIYPTWPATDLSPAVRDAEGGEPHTLPVARPRRVAGG
jgi:superfamily II RNA helicase